MGKKIHNPPPPTGMVRPTPPPNPPRVPCWQDDIDEVKRLTAALEQKQARINKLEFLLTYARTCDKQAGDIAWNQQIAGISEPETDFRKARGVLSVEDPNP